MVSPFFKRITSEHVTRFMVLVNRCAAAAADEKRVIGKANRSAGRTFCGVIAVVGSRTRPRKTSSETFSLDRRFNDNICRLVWIDRSDATRPYVLIETSALVWFRLFCTTRTSCAVSAVENDTIIDIFL